MALASNRLTSGLWRKARSALGIRFGRFALAALAAFVTSEVVLTICAGPLELTSTWASLLSWFSGAVVSYLLSRWAWERKGRPNVLRETVPFWVISAMVVAVLTVATKFAYHASGWMHLTDVQRVLFVDAVYGVANVGTFLLRFVFFHYVLFTGSAGPAVGPAARAAGRAAPAAASAAADALASTDPDPEPFASTDPDPEPFAMAADSTGPMRAARDAEGPPDSA